MGKRLFEVGRLGGHGVRNRVVMSPMTRARAGMSGVPTQSMATFYRQRSSAALIISEATHISENAYAWLYAPGIYTGPQIAGWTQVTTAVHARNGRIFCQLWHGGAASHRLIRPSGSVPVAPSAFTPRGDVHLADGKAPYEAARALELSEVQDTVDEYALAATNAKLAGFDGVELHAAGYLPQQFLDDSTNKRSDRYGGSIENRCRFVLEVIAALTNVWGRDRVGIKLGPGISFTGVSDSNPDGLYAHLLEQLNPFDLAYVHVFERFVLPELELRPEVDHSHLRRIFKGPYIANGNFDAGRAEESLREGRADFVAFGRPYIANPDLVERMSSDVPLNQPDMATFYVGGDKGYIDYPAM